MPTVKLSTRDKILDVCRSLFNERSPDEVTTSDIAEAVGISEGNLYYHFKRKEDMIVALFDQFEAALGRIGDRKLTAAEAPYGEYLAGLFQTIWDWQLFYTSETYRLAPSLQSRILQLTVTGQAQVRHMLTDQVKAGLLRATPTEIDFLVVNSWLVGSVWLDFLSSRLGIRKITREHLLWGQAQVAALFVPYTLPVPDPLALGNAQKKLIRSWSRRLTTTAAPPPAKA